jgi:hypothetical protein
VQRAAAALRRDDVEDVAERVLGDAERQLLVDVERPRPNARERQPDERCSADDNGDGR